MLNEDLPFQYPPALYAQKVQGNVTLRLYIDRTGQVTPDSTRIEESSGYAGLDSAAVKGSQELRFRRPNCVGSRSASRFSFPSIFAIPTRAPCPATPSCGACYPPPHRNHDEPVHDVGGPARDPGVARNRKPYESVLETIGWTPLIRLNTVTRGIRTPVYGKAEFFNPGGSVKDRIGLPIIEQAEREGRLKPGRHDRRGNERQHRCRARDRGGAQGLSCIFTMPDKMSQEKVRLLKAFGAEVIITPTAVPPDHPDNYVMMAKRIAAGDAERDPGRPVLQPDESGGALRDDGPGALGADGGAHHALRRRRWNGRDDHRRRAVPEGAQPQDQDHRRRSAGIDPGRAVAKQGRAPSRRARRTRSRASGRTSCPARST